MAGERILIIEDDTLIAETIATFLTQNGYQPVVATDFSDLMATFARVSPQLAMIDINLPAYNGFYWLQQIREQSEIPVLFLTSAGTQANLVTAMNLGADDFLSKPIELTVLLAKITGLLRRSYEYSTPQTVLTYSGMRLDVVNQKLEFESGVLSLTPSEIKILGLLFAAQGELVSRETIVAKLWESDEFIDKNALAVALNRLRTKAAGTPLQTAIETVKNKGYRLRGQK